MGLSLGVRCARVLIKIAEDTKMKPSERLDAARQLADLLTKGIGSRAGQGKRKAGAKAADDLLGGKG